MTNTNPDGTPAQPVSAATPVYTQPPVRHRGPGRLIIEVAAGALIAILFFLGGLAVGHASATGGGERGGFGNSQQFNRNGQQGPGQGFGGQQGQNGPGRQGGQSGSGQQGGTGGQTGTQQGPGQGIAPNQDGTTQNGAPGQGGPNDSVLPGSGGADESSNLPGAADNT